MYLHYMYLQLLWNILKKQKITKQTDKNYKYMYII